MNGFDVILCGDFHMLLGRLEDARLALNRIYEEIKARKPRYAMFSGDQTHTFAVVRVEILSEWNRFIQMVNEGTDTKLLFIVGNHDLAGAKGGAHSMEVFRNRAIIVDNQESPIQLEPGVYCLPFIRSKEKFESICAGIPPQTTLICHNSFNGARFENGFYDPDGADPACVKHLSQVIPGHIHESQEIGNIWFLGTPYQFGYDDAGKQKGIYYGFLSPKGFENQDLIDLGLPEFHVIQAQTILELLERLPAPVAQDYYKFEAVGTVEEIMAFWKDPRVIEFKSTVRDVKDALTSKKPETILSQVTGNTLLEKVNSFIKTRQWKVSNERLYETAGRFLGQAAG